jgi:hypothetical protein
LNEIDSNTKSPKKSDFTQKVQNFEKNDTLDGSNLDNYSIAESHEKGLINVFLLHFLALLKKKIVLQFRDSKTLLIEIFFPMIIIIAGMALSTIKVFYDGAPRNMTTAIYPTNNLIYNTNLP